jgi:hypothetical protein
MQRSTGTALVLFGLCLGTDAASADLGVRVEPNAHADPTLRTSTAATPPERTHAEDVVDYTLTARLDPDAHTVHGEGTILWRNTSRLPVHELWLHLYLNAFKNEQSVFLRERVGGRGSVRPADWGAIDVRRLVLENPGGAEVDLLPAMQTDANADKRGADETDAYVALPRTVAPGERIELAIAFDDKLPSVIERTGFVGSFHMVGQWFPKIARLEPDGTWAHFPMHHLAEFYADFGTYDVTLDVPEAFMIGATGPVAETRITGGRRIERHVQSDVHDFAWTAWDRWQTLRETIAGVRVTVLFPPGYDHVAARDLSAVRFALPYEASRYGAYPYDVLTVVHPEDDAREAGGMEYPTLITTEGPWWTPDDVLAPEIVTVHELGHQWFYGMVATNEAAWPFLDEGLNQYAEADAMAAWKGPGSAASLFGLRVSDAALQAVASQRGVHDEPVAQPASAFSTGAKYGQLVYARTAAIFETLARVYGVAPALGEYARRFRFAHPGPEDLLGVVAEKLGADVAATLRTALFDKGWVDYAVDGVWSRRAESPAGLFDRDGHRETQTATDQGHYEGGAIVRRRGTLSFPVDVELVLDDGSTRRVHWNGEEAETRIPWVGPVGLRAVRVDPDDRVVIDANLENNAAQISAPSGPAPGVLERLALVAQAALQWAGP